VSSDCKHSLIALTGFMGSGKSSVGRALATLLGWNFVDLDCEIERSAGRKIREIFASEGEAEFRKIEADRLRSVLATVPRPLVLATGGGTFVQSENVTLLRDNHATVVFLEAAPEFLLRRCFPESDKRDGLRPLAGDGEAFLRLYRQRLPLYRMADLSVDSNQARPEAVAREIAIRLGLSPVSRLTTEA
jgi:shikimate kinase